MLESFFKLLYNASKDNKNFGGFQRDWMAITHYLFYSCHRQQANPYKLFHIKKFFTFFYSCFIIIEALLIYSTKGIKQNYNRKQKLGSLLPTNLSQWITDKRINKISVAVKGQLAGEQKKPALFAWLFENFRR